MGERAKAEKLLTPGDPRGKLLMGVGASLAFWVFLVFFSHGAGVDPVIGLVGYAVGFFFSAWVGMHVYFFTTARTQEREWRQRYRVEHVEDIFGPLYDEIVKVVDSIEQWIHVEIVEWPRIKKSHYSFFVDAPAMSKLNAIERFLGQEYRPQLNAARRAVEAAALEAIRLAIEPLRLHPDKYREMKGSLDHVYLMDPNVMSPGLGMKQTVQGQVGNLYGTEVPFETIETWCTKAKEAANVTPELIAFRMSRTKALTAARDLLEVLGDRVQRPYAIPEG